MKLYEFMAIVLFWIASVIGSLWYGTQYQHNKDLAEQAKTEKTIEDTREAAKQGAADAISKIVVRNTTVQGRVETIVRDNTVYRDCQHDAATLQLLNSALTGKAGTGQSGDRSVSGTDAAH